MSHALVARLANWVPPLARFGHITTGIVYLVVGGVALKAALDVRTVPLASDTALRETFTGAIGAFALVVLAIGLAADCAWQVVRTFSTIEEKHSFGAIADRVGWLVSGLVHLALGIAAARISVGLATPTGEAAVKSWTEAALSVPSGTWLVGSTGVVIALIGLALAWRGWAADLRDRHLRLRELPRSLRLVVRAAWAYSLIVRGTVLALAGMFLIAAAVEVRPHDARGLGGILEIIRERGYGTPALALVAVGFLCNGVLEFVRARYRRIAMLRR